jgi:hypothetical protein
MKRSSISIFQTAGAALLFVVTPAATGATPAIAFTPAIVGRPKLLARSEKSGLLLLVLLYSSVRTGLTLATWVEGSHRPSPTVAYRQKYCGKVLAAVDGQNDQNR